MCISLDPRQFHYEMNIGKAKRGTPKCIFMYVIDVSLPLAELTPKLQPTSFV